jgi:hypothetical protein
MVEYIVEPNGSLTMPGQHRVTDKIGNDWYHGTKKECAAWVKAKLKEAKPE